MAKKNLPPSQRLGHRSAAGASSVPTYSPRRGQSRSSQEKQDRQQAAESIGGTEWFCYINPTVGLAVNLSRVLIQRVQDGRPEGERDFLDACQHIAFALAGHMERMRSMSFGQQEILRLKPPLPPVLHILIQTHEGEDVFYVNDTEFYTYR